MVGLAPHAFEVDVLVGSPLWPAAFAELERQASMLRRPMPAAGYILLCRASCAFGEGLERRGLARLASDLMPPMGVS